MAAAKEITAEQLEELDIAFGGVLRDALRQKSVGIIEEIPEDRPSNKELFGEFYDPKK